MAKLEDLKLRYRSFMRLYRYRSYDWSPGVQLGKELARCRVAVVTTAAFYLPGQEPFDERIRGGDCSYRIIPSDADLSTLKVAHKSDSFDRTGIQKDANLALPLERLRELVGEGRIGSLNHRHFSFMGSVTAPGRLVRQTAPEVAAMLLQDGVDAVLLTPV